ncbi:MAG: hypothetical protein M5U34_00970 [Chloroflexi bacterium]|nr:hypothetical protein [Chloroflexota bacterium]
MTLASLLPGVGDAVDVYDFGISVSKGQWAQAGTIAGMAILPGSARALRGAGGEIVEGVARNSDEIAGGFGDIFSRILKKDRVFQVFLIPKQGILLFGQVAIHYLKMVLYLMVWLINTEDMELLINSWQTKGLDSSGTVGYTVFYEGPEQLSVSWNSFSVKSR